MERHDKEYYAKTVNYGNEILLTKTSFYYLAANPYRLSLVCEALGEDDEALKHLDKAKRIAKVGGSSRNWMLLVVLLKLRKKYEEMGSLDKSDEYLREAKCVVKIIQQTYKIEGHDKEYYSKAVNYVNEIPVTKNSFYYLAANLYRLSLVCEALGENDEALKHLDKAKRIAKVGGSHRNWMLLVVLLKLRKKYEEMGSLDKSDEYLLEAKCVAGTIKQRYRMGRHDKEYYTKAVNYGNEIPVTKTSFFYLAANLYRLSLVCEALGEDDEALEHLDKAKRIAKVGDSYRNWMLLVVLQKLRKKYEEMGSLDKSDEYLREAKCVAENLYLDDVSPIVESLKEAGKDLTKQVSPLVKLGERYLDKAKTTMNPNDFTKANALFNAALVRSRHVRHEIDEDQILKRIVRAYREFLLAFGKDEMSADEIRNEIDSHKEWVAEKRKILKERVNEIDQNRKTKQEADEVSKSLRFATLLSLSHKNIVYIFALRRTNLF